MAKSVKDIQFIMRYDGSTWAYVKLGCVGSTDDATLAGKTDSITYTVDTTKSLATVQTELISTFKTANGIA
jgi:hypothetical protein